MRTPLWPRCRQTSTHKAIIQFRRWGTLPCRLRSIRRRKTFAISSSCTPRKETSV